MFGKIKPSSYLEKLEGTSYWYKTRDGRTPLELESFLTFDIREIQGFCIEKEYLRSEDGEITKNIGYYLTILFKNKEKEKILLDLSIGGSVDRDLVEEKIKKTKEFLEKALSEVQRKG